MKKSVLWACVLALVLLATGALADAAYTFNPEKPYDGVMTGLFNEIAMDVAGGEGAASLYLPEGIQPWAQAVIVMTPDNTTATDFAESDLGKAWRQVADESKIGVGFLAPQDGKSWNLTLDPAGRDDAAVLSTLYMTMRSKSVKQTAPFSMDKTHVALVGYGEGGAAALVCGVQNAAEFSAMVVVDAPAVSAEAMAEAGEKLILPFPADSTRGVEEMQVKGKNVGMPIWFVKSAEANADALACYIKAANAVETEGNEYAQTAYVDPNNEAIRIWVTEAEQTPATIYAAFASKTNRLMAMQDGGRVAFTTDFTSAGISVNEEMINGELRRWVTYVPSTYDASKETPLVLAIHGYTATAQSTVEESRWNDVAEENGFIVIYPQGLVREAPMMGNIPASCWIAGAFAAAIPSDDPMIDVKFVDTLIDKAEADYNIDKSRVYVTGHSNGSMMTWEMGVRETSRFAAIAPVGYMVAPSGEFSADCLLPTWSFMGEFDGNGFDLIAENANVGTLTAWNAHNGLDENKIAKSEEHDGQWNTVTFENADGVPMVRFTGILRTAHIYMPEESEAIWNFFKDYSRGEDGTLYYQGNAVAKGDYVQSAEWFEAAK